MKKNKLIKTIKQATAGLLAGAMVLTGAPLGSMTANAAVLPPATGELSPATPNNKVGVVTIGTNKYTFGSSDTTAYAFGNSSGHNGSDGSSPPSPNSGFNISGIVNEAHRSNNNKGYYNADLSTSMPQPILKTGYTSSWWHGFYGFGKPAYIANTDNSGDGNFHSLDASSPIDITGSYNSATGQPNSVNSAFNSNNIKLLLANAENGQVHTVTSGTDSVELRQEVKPSDDGQYIIVEYTAYNTSTNTVDIMVGHETDTELGNLDAVPIFITSHGKSGAELEGLHFHSNGWTGSGSGSASGKNYQSFAAFDIYSTRVVNGVQLAGMEKRDANDPSETRVRAGKWSSEPAGGSHRSWVFSQSKPGYIRFSGSFFSIL